MPINKVSIKDKQELLYLSYEEHIMDFKNTQATVSWSVDKVIKELNNPEYNVEMKLSVEMPRQNELHFIITTRNTAKDVTILKDIARSFYGYQKK